MGHHPKLQKSLLIKRLLGHSGTIVHLHNAPTPPVSPPKKRSPNDTYLHQPSGSGGTWYARVVVPRTLRAYVGQTHIRKSLGTSNKTEANRLKHAVVAKIKAELAALRKNPKRVQERGITFADARAWREEFKRLETIGDEEAHSTLSDVVVASAEEVERLYGTDKAKRWYRAATRTEDTLRELMDKWMEVSDYKESTKHGHRKALDEVLEWVSNEDAHPADITRKVVIDYIDNKLTQRGLAHTTIRDRLVSLGGFWSWMASRNAVGIDANPWTGHRISKKANQGTRPPKRAYKDDELIKLLSGTTEVKAWPTYAYLPDLIILGMYTGARLESLCSLKASAVKLRKEQAVLSITKDKNEAGDRLVGVVHPAALQVLSRRMTAAKKGNGQLFPELSPGGYDEKFSAAATKAYGRYRRACGVPDGTDFHSFRRNVITVLENAGVGQTPIARFVGHKVGTMAGDIYSAGMAEKVALEVARKVLYGKAVEAALTGHL
jgi:integrase